MTIDIQFLQQLIKQVAKQELMPRLSTKDTAIKADGSFVTSIDIAIQKKLQQELHIHWPEIPFFAEESSDDEMEAFFQHPPSQFWCLDPVDGTSNLVTGLPYFSISLALIESGETKLGLVYDPSRDEMFSAQKGRGAYLNNQCINREKPPRPLSKSIALIDLKRLPKPLLEELIFNQPYHSQRSLGSVALDWCWLAMDRVQVYLHGKQRIWDYAAGLLVAEESGCHSIGLDKQSVYQFNLEPRKAIGAVDTSLFDEWTKFIFKVNLS